MSAEELYEMLHERPFIPIRLHISNGKTYDIRHPETAIVAQSIVTVGLPGDNGSGIARAVIHCSLSHIVQAEPLAVGA
ncbi:MAG: hypothetical protein L0228_20510 [Planctomycetes bacterium]|nr:hypothetical protein [Planctomycetota bacterium]